jgi:predicted nucleic acid-binding protein
MNYVFDTSATVALLETCDLRQALQAFGQTAGLIAPLRVKAEYMNGARPGRDLEIFERVFKTVDVAVAPELLPYFNFDGECGEISVISCALGSSESCCVIDEGFGRRICALFGLRLTGSIGIIKELCRHRLISEEEMELIRRRLRQSSFYMSKELLHEV